MVRLLVQVHIDPIISDFFLPFFLFLSEFNYMRNSEGVCTLVEGAEPLTEDTSETCLLEPDSDNWYDRTAYRKIPYSSCQGGIRLDYGTPHGCGGVRGRSVMFWLSIITLPFGFTALVAWWYYKKGYVRGYVFSTTKWPCGSFLTMYAGSLGKFGFRTPQIASSCRATSKRAARSTPSLLFRGSCWAWVRQPTLVLQICPFGVGSGVSGDIGMFRLMRMRGYSGSRMRRHDRLPNLCYAALLSCFFVCCDATVLEVI